MLKTTITHSGSMDSWPPGHISIVDVRPNALPATIAGRLTSISDIVNFVSKTTHRPGRLRSVLIADANGPQHTIKVGLPGHPILPCNHVSFSPFIVLSAPSPLLAPPSPPLLQLVFGGPALDAFDPILIQGHVIMVRLEPSNLTPANAVFNRTRHE